MFNSENVGPSSLAVHGLEYRTVVELVQALLRAHALVLAGASAVFGRAACLSFAMLVPCFGLGLLKLICLFNEKPIIGNLLK